MRLTTSKGFSEAVGALFALATAFLIMLVLVTITNYRVSITSSYVEAASLKLQVISVLKSADAGYTYSPDDNVVLISINGSLTPQYVFILYSPGSFDLVRVNGTVREFSVSVRGRPLSVALICQYGITVYARELPS